MTLILIAALNSKRIIGSNGTIPWQIPEDLQHFKRVTLHHTVLMGRKTYESLGRQLPDRVNVVLSRHGIFGDNIKTFPSLDEALANFPQDEKVYIIGGGEIFRQTIDRADELMLTIVDNECEGDTYFPPYEHLIGIQWKLQSSQQHTGFRLDHYKRM